MSKMQGWIITMLQDGVQRKIVESKSYYRCPVCDQAYSDKAMPVLLECGHIVCSDQVTERNCGQEECGKLVVKKNPYDVLLTFLKEEDQKKSSDEKISVPKYKFMIRNYDKGQVVAKEILGDHTFHQLLGNLDIFTDLMKGRSDGIVLTVRKKGVLYDQIKKEKIHEYLQKHKLTRGLGPDELIQIAFSTRKLGGQ